jgi:hypothetical protein
MSVKLYVGNLPFSMTENDLTDLFAQAGNVARVQMINDRVTGRPRGFGFVEMGTSVKVVAAVVDTVAVAAVVVAVETVAIVAVVIAEIVVAAGTNQLDIFKRAVRDFPRAAFFCRGAAPTFRWHPFAAPAIVTGCRKRKRRRPFWASRAGERRPPGPC